MKELKRKQDCNKGDFGHALIIGGDYGMAGAAILAAKAAYRVGCGKVTIVSKKENYAAIMASLPSAMTEFKEINFSNKSVVAIGMGLGKSSWAKNLLNKTLQEKLIKVLDADALNLISENKKISKLQNAIITPHLGEAARLLGCSVDEIKKDRKKAAQSLQKKFNSIVVLKGHHSLICGKDFLHQCKFGNAGMATAGTGDVLSGIIAGLIAQKFSAKDAAISGVEIHARAGDLVAENQGKIGMMAQDLIEELPKIINNLE